MLEVIKPYAVQGPLQCMEVFETQHCINRWCTSPLASAAYNRQLRLCPPAGALKQSFTRPYREAKIALAPSLRSPYTELQP